MIVISVFIYSASLNSSHLHEWFANLSFSAYANCEWKDVSGYQGSSEQLIHRRCSSCFLSDSPQNHVGAAEGGNRLAASDFFSLLFFPCCSITFKSDDERESNDGVDRVVENVNEKVSLAFIDWGVTVNTLLITSLMQMWDFITVCH